MEFAAISLSPGDQTGATRCHCINPLLRIVN